MKYNGASDKLLRVHQFLPASRANGPGLRTVLWVQGCSLGCHGCFNSQTHSFAEGDPLPTKTIFEQIKSLAGQVQGITVSGGEPLQQLRPLTGLLQLVREETGLSIIVFTGYEWDELIEFREITQFLACVDVLIAGRYDRTRRLARGMRGSANKTLHFLTERYKPVDFEDVPTAEVIVTAEGEIIISGLDPVTW